MSTFYTNVSRLGNKILYRGFDHTGRIEKKFDFSPTLFLPTKDETTGWKGIHDEPLMPKTFDTIRDSIEFYKNYKDVENLEISGNTNYVAQFIQSKFPGKINFDPKLINVGNFDIEVKSDEGFPEPDEAKFPVISIAYKSSHEKIYRMWGLMEYDETKTKLSVPIKYIKCKDEKELLLRFIAHWEANCPDIITGWNMHLFDIPYICNRILRVLGEQMVNRLSPWGRVNYRKRKIMGREFDSYEIVGVQQIDYMDVIKKFDFTYGTMESYALDHVAFVILGERKLSYEEHGSLQKLFDNDPQLFGDYNVRDVELVDRFEQQLKLIERVMAIAYLGGVNYVDTLGTTGIWDSILYRFLSNMNIAVPRERGNIKSSFPGGHVKDVMKGKHGWLESFDLDALYPNLLVQYNMSPETLVDGPEFPNGVDHFMETPAQDTTYAVAANGARFRKDKQGVIPQIVIEYYTMRKKIKGEMLLTMSENEKNPSESLKQKIIQLDNSQMAVKILLNSLYGALGNAYFRYYDLRIATAVTLSGQLTIRWSERVANKMMNSIMGTDTDYVIAIDTDSIYVNMDPLVQKFNPASPVDFLDQTAAKKFVPKLAEGYETLFNHMNAYDRRMVMSREVIADKGVWIAKKCYMLNVLDNEGVRYAKPKMKIMGLSAVKSSTPQVVRDKFKECFKVIMHGTEKELQGFVLDFETEFFSLPPEAVSFPRGVTNLKKWEKPLVLYQKGCPIHVRGSIIFNDQIKQKKLDKKYEMIQNGTKIKFCYLKVPNHTRENVISFAGYLPEELDLHRYVDYRTQFEKTFKEPLDKIAGAIGWNVEHINTLEAFFK